MLQHSLNTASLVYSVLYFNILLHLLGFCTTIWYYSAVFIVILLYVYCLLYEEFHCTLVYLKIKYIYIILLT